MTGMYAGMQQQKAYDTQANQEEIQADAAISDAKQQMAAKAIQIQQAAGNQAEEYASSGVTLQGTPAQMMAQTRNLGTNELAQMSRKGTLENQIARTKANTDMAAGRSAILKGISNDATSAFKMGGGAGILGAGTP